MNKDKKETIFIICAHSDDHVLGAGGTIAKYTQEGKTIINIILSIGEKSHPWLKKNIIRKQRIEEARKADKILGSKTIFFNLNEGHFLKEYQVKKLEKKLIKLIKKHHPTKIFTHSSEDPHPDHLATNKIVLKIIEKIKKKPEVYVFSIWNPFSFKKHYKPKMYIKTTDFIKQKKEAIGCFASQKHIIFLLVIGDYIKSFLNGLNTEGLLAEKFYKIR